ncbi:MAG: sulfatase-like hydrolase/transferase, partial [Prosthecobacter sp.]|nr:sulfatase-like hydrolase/transferase [Prosthecobacter sp.]
PRTLGISGNYRYAPELPKNAATLPRWLKDQGWHTSVAGRVFPRRSDYLTSWEEVMLAPEDEGDQLPGMTAVLGVPVMSTEVAGKKERQGDLLVLRTVKADDADTPDGRAARECVAQMQKAAATKKPFFAAVGFMTPNFRSPVPQAWLEKFKDTPAPDPLPAPQNAPECALFGGILPERQVTAEERRQFIAGYRAQTAFMDAQAGLVLDALDKHGLRENTLVIFTSVNGYHLGDHGNLWGARTLYAQAAQVPLILAGPGVAAGQVCERVVELLDLYPTLLEHTGLKSPRVMDGESFAKLLKNPAMPHDDPALTSVQNYAFHSGVAVRTAFASLMRWGREAAELYNLQTDPHELRNLAGDKAMASALRKMETLLEKETR